METLEETMGYTFGNRKLLAQALTHPSLTAETAGNSKDNQRLEFLGDAVVQLVLTEHLYQALPDEAEGRLTQVRATLVSRKGLSACARRLSLGQWLKLGKGEEANGGRDRDSNLADAFEALMGALHLDGGISKAREILMGIMKELIDEALEGEDTSNPKGRLQEVLQAVHRESPVYRVVSEDGPDHMKQFVSEVVWRGKSLATGDGASKKMAEMAAAEAALEAESWKDE
jgi:ribonuclease-3